MNYTTLRIALKRPPAFGIVPLQSEADKQIKSTESETRQEVAAGHGPDARLQKYNAVHSRQIARFRDLMTLPEEGQVLFLLSSEDLNAYTLIFWLLSQVGYLDELFISTYNINQDIIRALAGVLDNGQVRQLSLVMSQSIESRMPERIEDLRNIWESRRDRMRVSLCWNHSKIAIAAPSNSSARYMITGSGNFSWNAKLEQYEVWADAALCHWAREALEQRCFRQRHNKRHKVWGVDE